MEAISEAELQRNHLLPPPISLFSWLRHLSSIIATLLTPVCVFASFVPPFSPTVTQSDIHLSPLLYCVLSTILLGRLGWEGFELYGIHKSNPWMKRQFWSDLKKTWGPNPDQTSSKLVSLQMPEWQLPPHLFQAFSLQTHLLWPWHSTLYWVLGLPIPIGLKQMWKSHSTPSSIDAGGRKVTVTTGRRELQWRTHSAADPECVGGFIESSLLSHKIIGREVGSWNCVRWGDFEPACSQSVLWHPPVLTSQLSRDQGLTQEVNWLNPSIKWQYHDCTGCLQVSRWDHGA